MASFGIKCKLCRNNALLLFLIIHQLILKHRLWGHIEIANFLSVCLFLYFCLSLSLSLSLFFWINPPRPILPEAIVAVFEQ